MFCYTLPSITTDIYDHNPQINTTGEPPLTRPKSVGESKSLLARHQSIIKKSHSFSLIVNNNDFDCSFSPPSVAILRDCFDFDYEVRKGSAIVLSNTTYSRSNSSSSVASPRGTDNDNVFEESNNNTSAADEQNTTNNVDDHAQQAQQAHQQQQQQHANADTTGQKKKGANSMNFKRRKVSATLRQSELTALTNMVKKPRAAVLLGNDMMRHRFAIVYVQDTQKKVSVTINDSTRSLDIIRQVIANNGTTANKENMSAAEQYVLHVASETGRAHFSVDETFPPLHLTTPIMNLGVHSFVLVQKAKKRESNSFMQFNRSCLLLQERCRGTLEDIILEVYKTTSPTIVNLATEVPNLLPVAPDLLIRDLSKIFATKYEIDEKKFQLYWVKEDGSTKTIPKHYRDRTFRSVAGLRRIAFVRIVEEEPIVINNKRSSSSGSLTSDQEDNDLVIPFDIESVNYQEFRVIKTNKFGVRQERKLGIDANTIHNLKPHSLTSFLGLQSSKTKHPERPLETLTAVTPNPDNPKMFTLDFTDGETLYYETRTTVECHEICKRLKYLLKLKKQEQNDSLHRRRSISSIMALNKNNKQNN